MHKMKEDNFLSYNESVAYSADNELNNVLYNQGDNHAKIIFKNIFRTAKKEILLYAKNIFAYDNVVSTDSDYVNMLVSFLKKENTMIKIILTDYNPEKDHNNLRDALIPFSNKIEIKINNNQAVRLGEDSVHLCIADNRMYRIEYNIKDREAKCNFNDPKTCTVYSSIFNTLFESPFALNSFI